MAGALESGRPATGRPPVTDRARLERIALEAFAAHGFEHTTVEDIARWAGIGRRTFFRYFPSKNDVVWGEFDHGLAELRAQLAATPASTPLFTAVRQAVLSFNALAPEQIPGHRARMELILHVPALQAHSTLRYAAWRQVIAGFCAQRLAAAPTDALPQLIAHTTLAAAVCAYEQWLRQPDSELPTLLDAGLAQLAAGFAALPDRAR